MPEGLSLHIGLNSVDPAHYQGWSGPLNACEADAKDMQAIAQKMGYTHKTLLTPTATRQAVRQEIIQAASKLHDGDIFMLTYSGHGGQLPDRNRDESDHQDETWCLFDGELVDDELYSLLGRLRPGVRAIVLSDSCHSGTVLKASYYENMRAFSLHSNPDNVPVYRMMPDDVALKVYNANKELYDPILNDTSIANARSTVKASLMLISGCQDNQLSSDGTFNGLFTATLLRIWANGTFQGSYRDLWKAIVKKMPPDQTPNLYSVGDGPSFEKEKPFKI